MQADRLVGSATAAYSTGAIEFELSVQLAEVPASRFYLTRRYREVLSFQAELVRDAYISSPVVLSAAKSATAEARRTSVEELLNMFTDVDEVLPPRLVSFLELERRLAKDSLWARSEGTPSL